MKSIGPIILILITTSIYSNESEYRHIRFQQMIGHFFIGTSYYDFITVERFKEHSQFGGEIIFPWLLAELVELKIGFAAGIWSASSIKGINYNFWFGDSYISQFYFGLPFSLFSFDSYIKLGYFGLRSKQYDGVLGDFLFHYGSYPGGIVIKKKRFDKLGKSEVRVPGIEYTISSPKKIFENKTIAWFDYYYEPYEKLEASISNLILYSPKDWLSVGGGFQLYRVNHIDSSLDNAYIETDSGAVLLRDVFYNSLPDGVKYFTPKSSELVFQLKFNPGGLFKWKKWKPADWTLNFETVLLGVENYPIFYKNRKDRVYFSSGFDAPTFRILDRALFEFQVMKHFFLPYSDLFDSRYQTTGPVRDKLNLSGSVLINKNISSWVTLQFLYVNYAVAFENWDTNSGVYYNIERENFFSTRFQFTF